MDGPANVSLSFSGQLVKGDPNDAGKVKDEIESVLKNYGISGGGTLYIGGQSTIQLSVEAPAAETENAQSAEQPQQG